jgi:DNA primase
MTNFKHFIDEIKDELTTSGRVFDLVYSGVEIRSEKQNQARGDCPFCSKENTFVIFADNGRYYCHHAGCEAAAGGDVFDYLEWRGEPFYNALERIAAAMGKEIPKGENFDPEQHKKTLERRALLSVADEHFKEALFTDRGAAALEYLKTGREYSEDQIKAMGLGAFVGVESLAQAFKAAGYDNGSDIAQKMLSSKVIYTGYPVTMAMRSRSGEVDGFILRFISEPFENASKYLYSAGDTGFEKSLSMTGYTRARGRDEVVICESPLGAKYLNVSGARVPFVAIGGATITNEAAELLAQSKTGRGRVILALDGYSPISDKASDNNEKNLKIEHYYNQIERNIKRLVQAGFARSSIFISSYHGRFADDRGKLAPDDIAAGYDIAAAEDAVNNASAAHLWQARRVAESHGEENLERARAMDKGLEIYLELDDRLERREFADELGKHLGITQEELSERFASERAAYDRANAERLAQGRAEELSKLAAAGKLREFERMLAEIQDDLRRGRGVEPPQPLSLDALFEFVLNQPETLPTGIKALDGDISVPVGALSFLGARSGHGKTTFLINLLKNWLDLEQLKDKRIYYLSYEEAAGDIAIKLLMMRSGVVLDEKNNFTAFKAYIKRQENKIEAHVQNEEIERAFKWYADLASRGRLVIVEATQFNATDLSHLLEIYAERGDCGAVLIDYIQKVRSGGAHNSRQLEIQAVTHELSRVVIKHSLTVFTAAQLNRTSGTETFITETHIRESEDIYNEAALVLGLYNLTNEKSDEAAAVGIQQIRIDVTKQRNGRAGFSKRLAIVNGSGRIEATTTENLNNLNSDNAPSDWRKADK